MFPIKLKLQLAGILSGVPKKEKLQMLIARLLVVDNLRVLVQDSDANVFSLQGRAAYFRVALKDAKEGFGFADKSTHLPCRPVFVEVFDN